MSTSWVEFSSSRKRETFDLLHDMLELRIPRARQCHRVLHHRAVTVVAPPGKRPLKQWGERISIHRGWLSMNLAKPYADPLGIHVMGRWLGFWEPRRWWKMTRGAPRRGNLTELQQWVSCLGWRTGGIYKNTDGWCWVSENAWFSSPRGIHGRCGWTVHECMSWYSMGVSLTFSKQR